MARGLLQLNDKEVIELITEIVKMREVIKDLKLELNALRRIDKLKKNAKRGKNGH